MINGVFPVNIIKLSALSPEGNYFATAGYDKNVHLWSLNPARELRVFEGHLQEVRSVNFSADGRFLISAGLDKTVRIWNVTDGRSRVFTFDENINSISQNPYNKRLLAVCGQKSAFIYDLENEKKLHNLEFEEGFSCDKVIYDKSGNTIAGIISGLSIIWNAGTGKIIKLFNDEELDTKTIAFDPLTETLLAGQGNGDIKFWDLKTGKSKDILKAHIEGNVKSVAAIIFAPGGHRFISAGTAGGVKFWERVVIKKESGACLQFREVDKFETSAMISEMIVDADFKKAVMAGYEGNVSLWNLVEKKPERIFNGKSLTVSDLAVNDNTGLLAVANDNFLYGVSLRNETGVYLLGKRERLPPVHKISLFRDKDWLAVCDWFSGILFYPSPDNIKLPVKGNSPFCQNVAFSPTEDLIAAVFSSDGEEFIQLEKLNQPTDNQVINLGQSRQYVDSLVFSRDGKKLAAASTDGKITIWNLTSLGEPRIIDLRTGNVLISNLKVAFSPDGKQIASSFPLKIWSVESGGEVQNLDAASYQSVAFSSDGKLLATGKENGQIVLWDTEKGKERRRFIGHDKTVNALFFSFNNSKLISGSDDGTVRFWSVDSGKELISLILLSENDWIAVTPDGFFEGTPEAQKQILWRLNNHTFDAVPIEAFFYEYYYPGLLKKVLDDQTLKIPEKAVPFTRKDFRQSDVRLCQKCPCSHNAAFSGSTSAIETTETEICIDILASAEFTTYDFPDLNSIIKRLTDPKVPAYKNIFTFFPPEVRTRLTTYVRDLKPESENKPDYELVQSLRLELGRFLLRADFFKKFSGYLKEPSKVLELRNIKRVVDEREWLNRRLLEGLFPEIRRGRISSLKVPGGSPALASDYETDQLGECGKNEFCFQDMRLFWNGKNIKRWRGDLLRKEDCRHAGEYRIQCIVTVPLVSDTENRFVAYLFNQDRVKSKDGEIIFK